MDDGTIYDVIVIGAGVAGCAVAYFAAQEGMSVLLVDSKPLGRSKVCGGCVHAVGMQVLDRIGVAERVLAAGQQINHLRLLSGNDAVTWEIPSLVSISRNTLDPILIGAAKSQGACFIDRCHALVSKTTDSDTCQVRLHFLRESHCMDGEPLAKNESGQTRSHSVVRGKVIVAADGLGHPSLAKLPHFQTRIEHNSYLGVGCVLPHNVATTFTQTDPLHLNMVVSRMGYAGICAAEDGNCSIAAAIHPKLLRANREPSGSAPRIARAVRSIIESSPQSTNLGLNSLAFDSAKWQATPLLTRSAMRLAGHRVFVVGDAAGYVEPFTGEGMSWALLSAEKLSRLISEAVFEWSPLMESTWTKMVAREIRPRQRKCRLLSKYLRSHRIAALSLPWIGRFKNLPRWLYPEESSFTSQSRSSA